MKVSVVIPVYNAKRYLRRCIDSVLKQTFSDWVMVLVDDGSTDGSGKICDNYAEKDNRIKVIHQQNRGSVEARKAGVLSEWTQSAKYVIFSDADDTLYQTALQRLYYVAEDNELDCVTAQIKRMWKGITFVSKYFSPCFQKSALYTNRNIIQKLYISCFGISDYPISLYAKLYKTELITKVIDYTPVVKFMGDDLSVTLRLLPEINKLGIIKDVVYNYRIGGGTSRFMPYMLDDFLALYRFKTKMRIKYPMPQDAEYYMAIEMLNILISWFEMYKQYGKHSNSELLSEIERVAKLPEVIDSLRVLKDRNKKHRISELLERGDYTQISIMVNKKINKDMPKRVLKQILYAL